MLPKPTHKAAHRFLESRLFENVLSFAQLEQRIEGLGTEQNRGDAFEVFAEAYFATQPIAQAKHVWALQEVPAAIRSALGLVTRDMGVDGVIETTLGSHDAYQVKFRSRRAPLTWDELATFMGLSDKAGQRILFTNSNDLPPVINKRRGFFCIRGADLDRLEARDFEAIRRWLESGEIAVARKPPKDHQKEALAALLDGLKQHDRATTVMACGSGKTLVELWLAERAGYRTILVLVPSLALVRQTLHEWLRETSWSSFTYLCVCSDPTVVKGTDEVVVRQSDLDFPVTTESAAVRKFLTQSFDGVRVVFSTYQSAEVVAKGAKGLAPFELGIFDEAHKTAGREGAKFAFALSDKKTPIRKRVFLTATPRHYDVRNKDKEGDATLVYSMDVPEVYGPVAYTLTFAEAAHRDIICGYKVLISVVTSDMVNEYLLRHGEVVVKGDPVKAQQVANQIAIQKAVEKYDVKRIFTFHPRVASAKSFVAPGGEGIGAHLPQFRTFHVNGEMRTADRDSLMHEFKESAHALMSNARCLTEGVDVPAVDMVAFMSPRRSKVDIVQAVGRAMRKSGTKTLGYVLVPVYLNQAKNETVEHAVERSNFDAVWDVLEALQEQDDVLAEVIRQLREERGRTGGYNDLRFKDRVEVLGPAATLGSLRKAITAECVERLGVSWDERYGQLLAYKERFGNCNVPGTSMENRELGRWCRKQRAKHASGKLASKRVEKLKTIGFLFEPHELAWKEMFGRLLHFKERYGNCDVPIAWKEDRKLGRWCAWQRREYSKRDLDTERVAALEEIGFRWNTVDDAWEESFHALVGYKERYGNCNVPYAWPENPTLARWCTRQRQLHRSKNLAPERTQRLVSIGFNWHPRDTTWEAMFRELKAYKKRFGNCNIPLGWKENPRLAAWCGTQRQLYKKGQLPRKYLSRLNELGFSWGIRKDLWEEMYSVLCAYKKQVGDCNVPQAWPENPSLGIWCNSQRRNYKMGKLSRERVARLKRIGFVWEPENAAWEEWFRRLLKFKKRFGDCNVPAFWSEDPALGTWCARQRRFRKQGRLSVDRINRLQTAGFQWKLKSGPRKWRSGPS